MLCTDETPLHSDILAAAETAYVEIAESNSYYKFEAVHRHPVCYLAAGIMVAELVAMGYSAVREAQAVGSGEHSYGVVDYETDKIIADPTWQQFISYNPSLDLPRVLIGTRGQVIAKALGFGMHASHTRFWQPSPIILTRDPMPTLVDPQG
jgi:hypothetical protein